MTPGCYSIKCSDLQYLYFLQTDFFSPHGMLQGHVTTILKTYLTCIFKNIFHIVCVCVLFIFAYYIIYCFKHNWYTVSMQQGCTRSQTQCSEMTHYGAPKGTKKNISMLSSSLTILQLSNYIVCIYIVCCIVYCICTAISICVVLKLFFECALAIHFHFEFAFTATLCIRSAGTD